MLLKRSYTEQELVDGCKQNDRRMQEALYKRYFADMLRMCRRYTHSDDLSAEIINTAFLKVFQKIDTYTYSGSLEGWVRRIVYHCVADHFRGTGKYRHFIVFEDSPKESTSSVQNGNDLEEKELLRLIDHLPNTSASVFRLYALEGFSHAEIAEKLQMSEGNSKWHLFQARKKLQESIQIVNGLY
jgi:RNA polymerase sigma factor (sigma-70 family)